MLRKRLLYILVLVLLAKLSSSAQSLRILSSNDGLPQSFVSGIVQDDSLFVWIGTRNGLARFDGVNFKIFQHDANDTTTIASNLIIWIKKNKDNTLWIEYESGEIDHFNPVTEKVKHLLKGNLSTPNSVQFVRRGWLVDNTGVFWGITQGKGIDYYTPATQKTIFLKKQNSSLPSDTVRGIAEIKNKIWLVTNNGISIFNAKTNRFINYVIPYQQDYGVFEGSDAIAIDLHLRANGELMWGDRSNLYFFTPQTAHFHKAAMPEVSYLGARWIRRDSKGIDYFENYGKVYRYDDNTGITKVARVCFPDSGNVKSFLVDRSGLLWLGSNAEGIEQIDLETPLFQSFAYKKNFITDIMQQVFGKDALRLFTLTPNDIGFSTPGYHLRSAYSADKKLYIGLQQSLCYYDTNQQQLVKLPDVPILAANQFGYAIKGISFLQDGSLIVVEYTGAVLIFDAKTNTWQPFIEPTLIRKQFGSLVLPQDMDADDKKIWITTANDGLLTIDIQSKGITQLKENKKNHSLPSDQLLAIEPDPTRSDLLWIGSYQGLICFHKKNNRCEVFSLKDGLPDNTVYSLLTDRAGKLWFSTNKGICQFDPVTHHVQVFRTQNGLPGDEFNRFHDLALPDGRLLFGGTKGWTIFNPLSVKEDEFEPSVAFTNIKINNKDTVLTSANAPLNALNKLALPYEQNTVSIGYAGLEFNQPTDIEYRYQLKGYDKDWIYAGNKREAIYTKIPSGNYTLLVNASNTWGKWSSHIKQLKIEVAAPWWGTKLAYLCYAIIIGGLVWTFIRFRVNRELMKQEIDLKEKESAQLRELDDMKSKFFSNITHEFRTPLTLITGPAEQIRAKTNDAQEKSLADTIVKNAEQMLQLINRLLDLSKLEAKAFILHQQKGIPADVIGSIVHSFENEAGKKGIQLSFEDKTNHLSCLFYADAVERILYNLVSNAIKFTQAGGKIAVVLSAKEEMLLLVVKDNGSGILKEKLPFVFERFYQIDKVNVTTGTGIGLALVKELVNGAKGTIDVDSHTEDERKGTTFTVRLPYQPSKSEPDASTAIEVDNEQQAEENKLPLILVVEDNTELANFITTILGEQYRTMHVLNGAAGLETALAEMPDVIVSDVMMPVMDGYELCRKLKEDIRTSHIPVVLLTAKVSQENRMEGLSKGADDYLTKPFHPTELMLRIHNLLEREQKLRALYQQKQTLIEQAEPAAKAAVVPQNIFLTKLYEQIEEHLDDSLFGVDQLADTLFISRSSLHRKLKSTTGMSTTEVVRNYRLQRAAEFLQEGYSSTDVAYKSGFGSPAYFSKNFRELYGITPGDYIKKYKG